MPFIPIGDSNPRITIAHPYVTWGLIGACVLVFVLHAGMGSREGHLFALQYGLIPATLTGDAALAPEIAAIPSWATVATSMFLHGGVMHLIMNMLFLGIFGDNVEDAMGHTRFVIFYLLCGAVAGGAHVAVLPGSTEPMIGASGAVSGVLGAYLILHPRASVTILFGFLPLVLPAWLLLGIWITFQVVSALGGTGGGVAWWAHVGGFAAGVVLVFAFRRRTLPLSRGAYPQGIRMRRPPR
ncbi:Membrane associated serine protease, rhomboid family [Limimonas halophila]|uniref:Membrane associated serine protease, rhomboid family n=1 Tax=Limimonas halophila TaxID=1082479 RepID=A0A1G7NG56_9PROT|nr:rhomboid family intramembrane serine protease [Limimonas halophila]SDF72891.1 Membrane associated serine protease, rhomboid family [Limimonas halophila]